MPKEIKKIVIFSAYYPPHIGGVERFTQNIADALIRKGIGVTVVTSSTSSEDYEVESVDSNGVHVLRLPSFSIFNDRFSLLLPSAQLFRLKQHLKEEDFDGYVVNTRYYPLCLVGCRLSEQNGKKPVLIDHSSGPISSEKGLFGSVMRFYERRITSKISKTQPFFCSVSLRGLEWLQRMGLDAHHVIPNSIDAKQYRLISSGRDWRSELCLQPSTFLITYAGRLIPEKGLPKLLGALESIRQFNDDIVLVIAGNGPLSSELMSCSNPHIKYVGTLNQNDLSALLAQTDCFCLPTEYPEGLPTVLLEAAAQCCAIVVSDCAGASEVVANDSMGIILPQATSSAIAQAISNCIADRTKTRAMGQNVRKHILSAFSWNHTADKLLAIISETA